MNLWLAPALVLVVGLVPVAILARRAAEEAASLRRRVRELGQLQAGMKDLRDGARALLTSLAGMRGT